MNFRALRHFVAAAEALHIGRAADSLGIAQPALSQQIRALEAELGVRLFHRANRRVTLTEAGRIFLAEARQILTASDRAVRLAREAERGTAGELHIGYNGSVVFEPRLRHLLERFRAATPDVTLTMHENAVETLLADLQATRLDIAFLRGPIGARPAGIAQEDFAHGPLVAALPAAHPLAERPRIALRDLADETFIGLPDSPGIGLMSSLHQVGERAGFVPRVMLQAGSVMSVLGLVGAGLGVSIIPQMPLSFSSPSFVLRPLDDPAAVTEVFLLYRTQIMSPVERRFLDMAREGQPKGRIGSDPSQARAAP